MTLGKGAWGQVARQLLLCPEIHNPIRMSLLAQGATLPMVVPRANADLGFRHR